MSQSEAVGFWLHRLGQPAVPLQLPRPMPAAIAAAPELLSALEALVNARVLVEAPAIIHADMWRRMDHARAAIAKAKGESA